MAKLKIYSRSGKERHPLALADQINALVEQLISEEQQQEERIDPPAEDDNNHRQQDHHPTRVNLAMMMKTTSNSVDKMPHRPQAILIYQALQRARSREKRGTGHRP